MRCWEMGGSMVAPTFGVRGKVGATYYSGPQHAGLPLCATGGPGFAGRGGMGKEAGPLPPASFTA